MGGTITLVIFMVRVGVVVVVMVVAVRLGGREGGQKHTVGPVPCWVDKGGVVYRLLHSGRA